MKPIHLKRLAAGLALSGITATAVAQYVWLDEKGVKQFSDMPPPTNTPNIRILKVPGTTLYSTPSSASNTGRSDKTEVNAAASDKAKAPMTTAEKNADFLKRRAEQADKEKKAAEQRQLASDKAKNCDRARAYNRLLESGERISHTDNNGERTFLTDEQRTREVHDVRRVITDCH